MPLEELVLDLKTFVIKMASIKSRYEHCMSSHSKHCYSNLLKEMIDGRFVYCNNCKFKINEKHVGQTIVINRRASARFPKWYCIECSKKLNLVNE